MSNEQPVDCPIVVDTFIAAGIKLKEWMESNFSDTDFDLDGCMAEAHAEFSNSLYDVRKYYREPAPPKRELSEPQIKPIYRPVTPKETAAIDAHWSAVKQRIKKNPTVIKISPPTISYCKDCGSENIGFKANKIEDQEGK